MSFSTLVHDLLFCFKHLNPISDTDDSIEFILESNMEFCCQANPMPAFALFLGLKD